MIGRKAKKIDKDKEKCCLIRLLEWLLQQFEQGILASIDCETMNLLKKIIYQGKKLHEKMFLFVKDKYTSLREEEMEEMIDKVCFSFVSFCFLFVVSQNKK